MQLVWSSASIREQFGLIDLLLRDGVIVDGQGCSPGALAISNGRILARFAPDADLPAAHETISAEGRLVLPGIVDPHVHFYGEGIGAYSRLAAIGGVTTFIGMIRGAPGDPLSKVVASHRDQGEASAIGDFSFHVVLYDRDDTLAQIAGLTAQGLLSFKMFLAYKQRGMMASEGFLIAAMAEIGKQSGIALVHCEDGEVIDWLEQRAIALGRTDRDDYAGTRPVEAEAVAIDTVALCAQITACPTYIVHVSSASGLAALSRARNRGAALWAETCPQYLLMSDNTLLERGPQAKIAPPLRSPADQRALRTALQTGEINTIGSDHASHAVPEKQLGERDIFAAPFGMPGSPTLWPSMFTWAEENGIPLPVLVRAMAETPARLFGLGRRKGHLQPGADADLIVLDPTGSKTVDAEAYWPHVAPSPLAGKPLRGWPDLSLSRGEVVWRDGQIVCDPGRGQFIAQRKEPY
jgi:dihydroorotase-like cyclic amidohydrolase